MEWTLRKLKTDWEFIPRIHIKILMKLKSHEVSPSRPSYKMGDPHPQLNHMGTYAENSLITFTVGTWPS